MAVTRDDIIQQYLASIEAQKQYNKSLASQGWDNMRGSDPYGMQTAAMSEENKQTKLRNLLGMGVFDDNSASNSASANPFGGVPTVDTSNRFEAGLSDAESRLRSLLDNPDSITQSAAYKFRVGQGQEALQRSLGAKGLLNSGNRLMELTKYGQDMGSQEYDAQAGRLGSLLGNYTGGYTADKNANTSRFAAESSAWNTAQGNADANRYRMGSLAWEMQKPQGTGRTVSIGMTVPGTLGGIGGSTPVDWGAFTAQQNAQRDYLDRY